MAQASQPSVAPQQVSSIVPQIAMVAQLGFNLRAESTGFKEYNIDDQTAQAIATSVDQCMTAWLPGISYSNPKLSSATAVVITLGLTIFYKEMALKAWRKEQKPQSDKPENKKEEKEEIKTEPIISGPKVSALEFFPQPEKPNFI